MFEPAIIRDEFMGLVGLRQTDNPEFAKLDSDLLYTGSNILVNHPLINVENIQMLAKDFSRYEYPIWDIDATYEIGDRTKIGTQVYEALQENTGQNPATPNSLFWKTVNLMSLFLEDIFKSTIETVVNDMFNLKRDVHRTKTLIQSLRFYEGAGNLNDKILNDGKLVGVMIELVHSQNLVAIVERIGTQFTAAGNGIPLYIYHSSQPKPILTIAFNQTVAGGFQWTNPVDKIKLHALNDNYDANGYFFIMYNQNNMGGGMAINKRMNFNIPCPSCSGYNYSTFQRISRYISIRAVSVDSYNRVTDGVLDPDGTDFWNVEKTRFDFDTNYGLNFDFTVRCDATDFLVRQKDVFSYAIRDNIIVRLLDLMVNSTRQTGMETKVAPMANIALSASSLGGGGLRERAERSIKNIDFELSTLDQVCMPCANDAGVKVKSFGLQSHGNNLTGR